MTTPNQQQIQIMTHVILLAPKADTSDKDLEKLFQAAHALKKHIPCLLAIAAGENHSTGHRGFTHGIVMHFTDEAHQRDAIEQPVYLKLREKAMRSCEQMVIFDLPETLPLPAAPAPPVSSRTEPEPPPPPTPTAAPAKPAGRSQERPRASYRVVSVDPRLARVIIDQLGVDSDEVVPRASFVEDLNADSLDLVELMMSIEEAFAIEISDEDAEKLTTAEETQQYLMQRGVL